MQALIVIDAQNEFSEAGMRPVPNHSAILKIIRTRVEQARISGRPIAWVRHHNRPTESPAFIPGSWGAQFSEGFGQKPDSGLEREFEKSVYGAFTGTELGSWLQSSGINEILVVGFYTHGCLSTTAREAIMLDLKVSIDSNGTGACDMTHELLGSQTADEVRRTTLLHLAHMGATIISTETKFR